MSTTIFDHVSTLLPDHPAAVGFLHDLFRVMHVWDDLIDRDHPVDDFHINWAFTKLLLAVPANPFYQQHFAVLHPLLSLAVIEWRAANALEATDDQLDKEIAFITRSSYAALVIKVVELCLGFDAACHATPGIRRVIHQEGFPAYLADLRSQKGT